MDNIINTGALFIKNLLHLDVVTVKEDEMEELTLPSPYVQAWENQLVKELALTAGGNEVSFFNDSFLSYYCLIHLEKEVVMIGPYREHTMTRAEARRRFPEGEFSEQAAERYVKWYNSQVLQEQDIVKLAAHTMVVAIYGSVRETKERQINIQRYAKNHRLIPENLPQDMSSADSLFFNELSFQYMAYIREGNYEGAVTAYNKIMQYTKPHKTFALIDTIEGISNIRTMTRLATQEAGVPITAAQTILEEFKGKVRIVTSKREAVALVCKMISDICTLVRQYKTADYSPSIALAVDYIHRNLARNLAVPDIAKEIGLSPGRLSTKFREEVGIPVIQYILEKRMEEAADLLIYTNLDVQDICTQIGILDSNYFSRRFKKAFGVSPVQYRKRHMEEVRHSAETMRES